MRTVPLLLVLCAAHALPAQQRYLDAVLLVRYGAGDLVLNEPLVSALLAEPHLTDALREALGKTFTHARISVTMPASHLPGTSQIHFHAEVNVGEWSGAAQQAGVDAIAAHLERRFQLLLHDEPKKWLVDRRLELQARCADCEARRVALARKAAAADEQVASLRRQLEALDQQLVAARIDTTTEERALAQLEQLASEHTKRRDAAAAERARRLTEQRDGLDRLRQLEDAIAGLQEQMRRAPDDRELAARRDILRGELQALVKHQGSTDSVDDLRDQDAQRLLAATLEQLPTCMLALHRARARLQSIEEERSRLAKSLADARVEREQADDPGDFGVELTVARTMLAEVQGKLARLEPVRIEVLQQKL